MQASVLRVREQHRVIKGCNINTVARKNLRVVFHVLANFHDRLVFEQRFQSGNRGFQIYLTVSQIIRAKQIIGASILMGQGNVARLARLSAERNPNKISAHVVQARRLGIHCNITAFIGVIDPGLQRGHVANASVCGVLKSDGFRGITWRRDRDIFNFWHRRIEGL